VGAREEERGGVLSGVSTGGGGTEQRRALEIAEGLRTDGERGWLRRCCCFLLRWPLGWPEAMGGPFRPVAVTVAVSSEVETLTQARWQKLLLRWRKT
jgi:hypothetical protein